MSRFVNQRIGGIAPYAPGEQPRGRQYIKLNTNESPYPPAPRVLEALTRIDGEALRLYPDPQGARVKDAAARTAGLAPEQVFAGGGSDEILGFAFMAFCHAGMPVYFPDISYGFYQVYADLLGIPAARLPLEADFTVNVAGYCAKTDGPVILANPNAPTGICLEQQDIRRIVESNPNRLVLIDEAYIAFAPGCSVVALVKEYDNLLVVQTMSKAASLAGMRLGLAYGHPDLIADLEKVKYSFNPYNLDRISIEVAIAALESGDDIEEKARCIIAHRQWTADALTGMGFDVLPSRANFLFARHPSQSGKALASGLRDRGILVRHFDKPRIADYLRISIGTHSDMEALTQAIQDILKEAAL